MNEKCNHMGPQGGCGRPQVDGSDYCERHSDEAERIKGYHLDNPAFKERFDRLSDLSTVKQEVSILRALLESKLSFARNDAELIAAFQSVRPAVVDIVNCVEKLQKLERQADLVLSKEALMEVRNVIVKILTDELSALPNYESIVDRVAKGIAKAIADASNKE